MFPALSEELVGLNSESEGKEGLQTSSDFGAREGLARRSQESRASLLPPGCDVGHASSVASCLELVGPHSPRNFPGPSRRKKTMTEAEECHYPDDS